MPLFSSSNLRKPGKRFYVTALMAILIAVAAFFFLQKAILTRTAGYVVPLLAASAGLDLQWDRLQVGLFIPMTLEGVRIWGHSAVGNETSLRMDRMVVNFSDLWEWWRGQKRFFSEIRMEGAEGVLDFRASTKNFPNVFLRKHPHLKLMMFPWVLKLQAPDLNLLFDGVTYRFRNFSADLSENSLGAIQYSFAKVETPFFEKRLPFAAALASWKLGTLGVIEWHLLPSCVMELMNINFLGPEGLGIDFSLAAFRGTIKGSLAMKNSPNRSYWDAAFVAQRVELGPLANALEIRAPVRGILKEGKLTFRGQPKDIRNAEASLHISAEDFRWSNLGWQTLEFGVDFIDHRIVIPEFHLRQKENFLSLNGSATIPKDFHNLSKTPFEISVLGNIQDLEAVAGLLGPKFGQLHGRMTLDGSLWSGKDGPNGYLKLEASSIRFRDAQFTAARLNTIFRHGKVDITSCELWNGEDFLVANGTLNLNIPGYQYSGKLSLRTREIAAYQSLMNEQWQKRLQSGGGELTWKGDGVRHRHSGAFSLRMDHLISEWAPRGITGSATGTFSRDSLSLDSLELWQGPLRLTTRLSLSPFGIEVSDFRLNKGAKQLAQGAAFFPIDPFAIANGTSWKNALRAAKPSFVNLNSKKFELNDLWHLTGQNIALSGSIESRLSVIQNPSSFDIEGYLLSSVLQGHWKNLSLPPTEAQISLRSANNNVVMTGKLLSRKLGEIRGDISLPLNSKKASIAELLNSAGSIRGSLQIEKLDISAFKFLFPGLNQLAGTGKANLLFKHTLSDPKVDGSLGLKQGVLKFSNKISPISDVQLVASIKNNHLSLETFQGKLKGAPFFIKGGIDFSRLDEPWYQFHLIGNKLLLYQDPDLTLQANVNLLARGSAQSGKILGTVRFQDSALHRRVEITTVFPNALLRQEPFQSEKLIPTTLARWDLDVSISNDTPFVWKAKLTNGQLAPHLHLGGQLRNISPSGSIEFKNLRVFFPFAVAEVDDGRIFFDSQYPKEAFVDAHGSIDAGGYSIQMTAAGSLMRPSLFFTSDPPLSQQYISLLLLTGRVPYMDNFKIGSLICPKLALDPMFNVLVKNLKTPPASFSPNFHPLPFSFMQGRTLYEFPATTSDYFFKLAR
ncbi:MAG: hypothetical protein C5B47_06335 [Verrucomicrobia bacterium]|nr:MAG: hypothetical protein C5B47_06335 [Verrucomicrobiota bacterium]